MIVYMRWQTRKGVRHYSCDGWFLLGFIPLYLRRFPL